MTTNDIDAIRARADAAGSGPWWVANLRTPTGPDLWQVTIMRTIDTPDGPRDEQVCVVEYETCGFQYPHFDAQSDAAFIANARQDVPALLAKVDELTAERDAARHETTQALHALDKARAVIEAGLSSDERRRAANAIRAYIRLCGSRIESDHPLHTIADKLAAAVDALPEPHADLYGDGHWVNRDGTCWSDCPACHPITTEATANTDDQPCCGYRCQDNTTGVTA